MWIRHAFIPDWHVKTYRRGGLLAFQKGPRDRIWGRFRTFQGDFIRDFMDTAGEELSKWRGQVALEKLEVGF